MIVQDVSSVDTSTTLFGASVSLPVITAPMGGMLRWCSGGAQAAARAAATSGMMTCLSSLAGGLGGPLHHGSAATHSLQL